MTKDRFCPLSLYSIFASRAPLGLIVLGFVMGSGNAVQAQQTGRGATAGDEQFDASTIIRYETKLRVDPTRPELTLRVVEERVRRRTVHHLDIFPEGSTQSLCRVPLQREFVARHYEHRTSIAQIARATYMLLVETHVPDPSLAPPDPTQHQLALELQINRRGQWTCRLAARGEHSRLDGGRLLRFDREPEPPILLRSDTTDGTRFCGLRDIEGHSNEVYDPAQSRFVPQARVSVIMEGAQALKAVLPDPPFQPPYLTAVYSWAWATSDYRGTPSGAVALRPLALGDLDVTTAWIEGGNDLGKEEYVTASINDVVNTAGFRIFPGHGRSPSHHEAYARPTRILVSLAEGTRFIVDLGDAPFSALESSGGLFVSFPEPVRTNCMSVMILESRTGKRDASEVLGEVHRTAAISEITPVSEFYGESARETAQQVIADIAREPGYPRRERLYQLTGLLGDHLVNAIQVVLTEGTSEERQRVIPLLGRLQADLALPLLNAAFKGVSVDAREYRVVQRTLAAHGSAAAQALLDILHDFDVDEKKHVDLIRLIGRIGAPDHIEALLPGLGEGEDFVRNERIRALAHGQQTIVDALVAVVAANPDTPAAYDAFKTLGTIGRRLYLDRGTQSEAPPGLLAATEKSRLRRHILRGLIAMGYFALPEGIDRLRERYLEGSPDPLVRKTAASALRYYPAPVAREALEAALGDPSPDVRIAAIGALANREDRHQSLHRILTYAEGEEWPQALHHAYEILAEVDTPETKEFFEQTLWEERNGPLSIAATRALKRAERPLDPELFERLLTAPLTTYGLRRQLIDLLGFDQTPEGEAILFEILRRRGLTEGVTDEERGETIERHAILAIGLRRSETGQALLFEILTSDEDLNRRQHAARGLGFYADRPLAEALREFESRAPEALQPRIAETIRVIESRLAIIDAGSEVRDAIEALDAAPEEDVEDVEDVEEAED